jgi:hypothetical protein
VSGDGRRSVALVTGGQQERLMGTGSGGAYKGVGGQARRGRRHKLEDLHSLWHFFLQL